MKSLQMAVTLGAVAVLGVLTPAQGADKKASKVVVTNQSDWQIDHLYMAPADDDDWGPDQLGEDVISKGEKFTLTNIPCNTWDIKVVDEDGDECVIENVDLCKETAEWKITSKDLLACQKASQ